MSKNRRTHSTIDKLPANLRETLTRMIVDNYWPQDWDIAHYGLYTGNPRYIDLRNYCQQKGFEVSESAIGRFGMQMRTLARMKNAGLIARETMAGMTAEDAPKTQKAAAEMATALILEFMASHDGYSSKQIKETCQAIRDCAQVSIKADKYIREQLAEKIKAAVKSTKKKLFKAGVNRKVIQEIVDEHLGVTKS